MGTSVLTPAPVTAAADRPVPGAASSARQLLWAALRTRRRDLTAASVLYSTHQLGESMVPVIIGATISQAVDHGSWASIGTWLAVLAADFAFLSSSYRFGARASMRAKQHVGHQARMWLADRVVAPAGGVRFPPGDLLSRASSDANRVGAYAGMLATAVAATVVLIVSTALLLWFSLVLGAVIVAGTAALLLAQNAAAKVLRRRSTHEQDQRAQATALAEDLVRGLRVLKGVGAQRNAAAEYQQVSQAAVRASLHAVSAQATLASVGTLFTGLYLVIIAGVGGWLALDGHLDLGQLVAALGLAQFLVGPMQVVSGASAAYARALASAERIRQVLLAGPAVPDDPAGAPDRAAPLPDSRSADEPDGSGRPDSPDGATDPGHAGELEFAGVELAAGVPTAGSSGPNGSAANGSGPNGTAAGGGRIVLAARVPAGSLTGIVCGDPVAAARIPQFLARELDPLNGTILLDRTALGDLPLDLLRARVLVSYHDTALLPGTIAENLDALAADPATSARAATAAFADEVVKAAPDGAQTLVGDRGETLSGGQRQRVALARALAADPPVLVLHDPTTAVDAATEDSIAGRVRALRTGRTTVVVTTSPAWLARCDHVIFLTPAGPSPAGTAGRAGAGLAGTDLAGTDSVSTVAGTHQSLLSDPDYQEAVAR